LNALYNHSKKIGKKASGRKGEKRGRSQKPEGEKIKEKSEI